MTKFTTLLTLLLLNSCFYLKADDDNINYKSRPRPQAETGPSRLVLTRAVLDFLQHQPNQPTNNTPPAMLIVVFVPRINTNN